jgi:predicted nucleic acid-binding protein
MSGDLAFLDTNILVYAFAPDDPVRSAPARLLLEKLMEEARLCTSTQVLQELFVTLTRKLKIPATSSEALRYLDVLAANEICTVDYSLIREAAGLSQSSRISFGDALVIVAALRSGAKILYTEDLQHGQTFFGLRVVNPFR